MMRFTGSDPRPYRDESDIAKMCDLLQKGRKAANGTYYVHVGDLNWWLFYPAWAFDLGQDIWVWDDPTNAERLLGWALISSSWSTFDVYIDPFLRGTPLGEKMYLWAEERLIEVVQSKGRGWVSQLSEKTKIRTMWIAQDDLVLDERLNLRGFRRVDEYVCMTRSLMQPLIAPVVPQGYVVRHVAGHAEASARAAAQYGAFGSIAEFDHYLKIYQCLMCSPVYTPQLDVVVVAPDGRIGAFCIVWTDSVNQVGYFEPVGTHPDFQRMGLGKAVMLEGLRRLQERGMTSASVCTPQDNLPAIRLYEAAGFGIVNRLGIYETEL